MPYIKPERRVVIKPRVDDAGAKVTSAGELNYAITLLCIRYLRKGPVNYARFNEVMGVLECAKQEFYRTQVVPYEEEKRAENGDV